MSIQLVTGSAGSGKSTWLYNWVLSEAQAHSDRKYIVIVPEQFTMSTQRELVMRSSRGGILNVDVLPFKRLALRIFEETGTDPGIVLTETGKNLMIRRAAGQCRAELETMKGRLDKPGYISQVKSIMSEFAQYEIDDEMLDDMIQTSKSKGALHYKLQDIRTLREKLEELKAGKYITGEEILDVMARVCSKAESLKGVTLVFDGFTGFTPVQLNALYALAPMTAEMKFTVTIDPSVPPEGRIKEHELFAMSRKFAQTLLKMAKDLAIPVDEPVVMRGEPGRFAPGSGLEYLERHLFRYGRREAAPVSDDITVEICARPLEELERVAAQIRRMIDREGYRCREIAVICGDLASYSVNAAHIFDMYQIPYFIDETVVITMNPCLEFIRAAIECAQDHYSYEGVFRFLRTGVTGIDREKIDLAENYVLAMGIRGANRWQQSWEIVPRTWTAEEVAVCEEVREALIGKMLPFTEVFKSGTHTVEEYSRALLDLLTSFSMLEAMDAEAQRLRDKGERAKAAQYEGIYEIVIKLLDETVSLIGDESVTPKEYAQILEAGFEEARVGIIPPGIDEVHIGDMERTRLEHIRALFFVGLNDGWVPASGSGGGIISESEREFLGARGVALAPGERENGYIQRFYLYLCMTKPSEKLNLSYSLSSGSGDALRPSYLAGQICRMLGKEAEKYVPEASPSSMETGTGMLADALREGVQRGEADARTMELMRQYLLDPAFRARVGMLYGASAATDGHDGLDPETALALYGKESESSVTRLQDFAGCAFEHFARYGLDLDERVIYSVRPADTGNIYHKVLQMFSQAVKEEGGSWKDLPADKAAALLDSCLDSCIEEYNSGLFKDTKQNEYKAGRIREILHTTLTALIEQVRAGEFEPTFFEQPFRSLENMPSVSFDLGDGARMRLKGSIDRVDLCRKDDEVLVKVVDYKSSDTDLDLTALYYGVQLQLIVYLNAAMDMVRRTNPGLKAVPAGVLYSHIQQPVVDTDGSESEEEIVSKRLAMLKPAGRINNREDVVMAMDKGAQLRQSPVIPVKFNKDGSFSKASKVISTEQFETLQKYTSDMIVHMGQEMTKGSVKASPLRRKDNTTCDYCPYRSICGYDRSVPGFKMRDAVTMDNEEAFAKIAEEINRGSGE